MDGPTYLAFLEDDIVPALEQLPFFERRYFQQDGAGVHSYRNALAYLEMRFPGRVHAFASQYERTWLEQWPPRLCDLFVCDFFVWPRVKSLTYTAESPRCADYADIVRRVTAACRLVTQDECLHSFESFHDRLEEVVANGGGHIRVNH